MESTGEDWYIRRGHKYFLYEYERSLLDPHEELPPLSNFTDSSKEQRTTEHILPQHPEGTANCWWDNFSPEEHAGLCHSLGNLALTYDNSAYSNKCFEDKRGEPLALEGTAHTCYAQGKLSQERELAAYRAWTPETIKTRQSAFADWALQRWAVTPPGLEASEVEDTEFEAEGANDSEELVEVEDAPLP